MQRVGPEASQGCLAMKLVEVVLQRSDLITSTHQQLVNAHGRARETRAHAGRTRQSNLERGTAATRGGDVEESARWMKRVVISANTPSCRPWPKSVTSVRKRRASKELKLENPRTASERTDAPPKMNRLAKRISWEASAPVEESRRPSGALTTQWPVGRLLAAIADGSKKGDGGAVHAPCTTGVYEVGREQLLRC